MMKSRFLSLVLVSLCGALLRCSPNHEPHGGKTEERQQAAATVGTRIQTVTKEYGAENQLAALRQAAEAVAKQRADAAATRIQTVVRKHNAEKQAAIKTLQAGVARLSSQLAAKQQESIAVVVQKPAKQEVRVGAPNTRKVLGTLNAETGQTAAEGADLARKRTITKCISKNLAELCGTLVGSNKENEVPEGERLVKSGNVHERVVAINQSTENQLAALKQTVEAEAKRKAEARQKIAAAAKQRVKAATKIQTVVRKYNAGNQLVTLRKAAEEEAKQRAEAEQIVGESAKRKAQKRRAELTTDMTRTVFRRLDNNELQLATEGDSVEEKEVVRKKATEERVKSLKNDLEKLREVLKLLESKIDRNKVLENGYVEGNLFINSNKKTISRARKGVRDALEDEFGIYSSRKKKNFSKRWNNENSLIAEVIREESEDNERNIKIELDEAFEELKQRYEKFEAGHDKENETLQEEGLTELRSMYKQLKKKIKREDEALRKRFEEIVQERAKLNEKLEKGGTVLETKLGNREGRL